MSEVYFFFAGVSLAFNILVLPVAVDKEFGNQDELIQKHKQYIAYSDKAVIGLMGGTEK